MPKICVKKSLVQFVKIKHFFGYKREVIIHLAGNKVGSVGWSEGVGKHQQFTSCSNLIYC